MSSTFGHTRFDRERLPSLTHPPPRPPPPAPRAAVITTFAIISAVVGSSLPIQVIIMTGFATMIGDALSMGVGDAVSEAAEEAYIRDERKREAWEMTNNPEGEVAEMVAIYQQKGFTKEEATRIMELMTRSPTTHEYFIK